MRFPLLFVFSLFLLVACVKGENPDDPYESINRQTYKFNYAFDTVVLKPVAKIYQAILPPPVRTGVNNFYNNIALLPAIANDLLQGDPNYALKDTWRLFVNTTFGVVGVFDPASRINLPPHRNDLGLTFAKWGDKKSPYIVIPFLGPSTIRDGMGMLFDYTIFTPYPYIPSDTVVWSLIGVRYVDLRAQMLETDKLMDEAMDKYSFMRDAYLQHRNYLITGQQDAQEDSGDLYVDDVEDDSKKTILPNTNDEDIYPILSAVSNATRRTV
ncbi:lipoprotein VacJ-like protein (plasmid) [Legionella adelaidensis]|uniref:Lipoprotein VacJ-like protein n=1 Tax=Legionella adelaidensis TaxID=45056 RepID=A0A0W0R3A8_9GAMM|nr:VacJ family lipoprotein [Legionella adelaidensis]KTC65558.1 lipoprotein VacJ-like protein [Legionella adelaidensis]VEH84621.1 lipoprotein VacJ-like protein [Legionella adelaidensis]